MAILITGATEPNTKLAIHGPSGSMIETTSDSEGNWSITLDVFKSGGGADAAGKSFSPLLGIITI